MVQNIAIWAGIVVLVAAFLLGVYFFMTRVVVRSYIGHGLYLFLHNNNNWLTLWFGIFVVLLGYSIHYGFGEPILTTSFTEAVEAVKKNNPETISTVSKAKNILLYGQDAVSSDVDIDLQKKHFKNFAKKHPIIKVETWRKSFPEDTDDKQYLENARNHLRYGLFASDIQIGVYRNEITVAFQNDYNQKQAEVAKVANKLAPEKKSWAPILRVVFWIFVGILVLVIVSRDEVADIFEAIIDYVKNMREEVVNQEKNNTGSSGKSSTSDDTSLAGKMGWFTRLYSSDMAAEFSIKLFEKFISFFRR